MRFFKDHPPVDARWETLEQPSWEDDRQAHTLPDLPEGPLSLESTVTTATQTLWMHGRPRSSPGLQGPAEIQIIERMWFKDILRIARRIQQNSRRLRPARRAKLRRCEEEVSSCYKELVALVNQDIRDLVLIIQYIGEGKSGLISKELHHCQLALTDLLTNIELVVTDSIILGEQVLIQLHANTKVRSLAKYATHQAQILENAVAPNADNSRLLDRSLRQRGTRAATAPPKDANKQGRGRRTPALENYGGRGSSFSRERSPFSDHCWADPFEPISKQTIAGRIRLSPSSCSRTLADHSREGRGSTFSRDRSPFSRENSALMESTPVASAYSGQQGHNRDTTQRRRDRMHAIVQHNMILQNILQSGRTQKQQRLDDARLRMHHGRASSLPLKEGQAALVQALLEPPPRGARHDRHDPPRSARSVTPSLLSLPATASNGGRAASLTAYSSRLAPELSRPLVHASGTHLLQNIK